jgi:hypothetical protein
MPATEIETHFAPRFLGRAAHFNSATASLFASSMSPSVTGVLFKQPCSRIVSDAPIFQ